MILGMKADAVGYGAGRVDPRLAVAVGMPQTSAGNPAAAAQPGDVTQEALARALGENIQPGSLRDQAGDQLGAPPPAGTPAASEATRPALPEAVTPEQLEAMRQRYQPDSEHDWGQSLGADAREGVRRIAAAADQAPAEIVREVGREVNTINRVINPWARYVTGGSDFGEIPGASQPAAAPTTSDPAQPSGAAQAAPAPAPQAPAPAAGRSSPLTFKLPEGADAQATRMAQVGQAAMAQTSPAVKDATAAAVAEVPELGAPGARPVTDGQRQRGVKAFMDRYLEHGAPIVIREMLKQGDVDGLLTLKDEATGKTFQQRFASTEEMVQAGMMLSPENAFKFMQEQVAAGKTQAVEAAKIAREDRKDREKALTNAMKMILDASKDGITGRPTLTLEEARAQAEAFVNGESSPDPASAVNAAAPVPVARRGQ
ncbi:hypothetical protein [Cereibacter sphaeroides]|uniref:hypothetical protein n=1 Tax=Cereibacter sphaeroides TaxID=1063 RepID=UPI000F5435AD|nr:hypothetical protein [Cereibacter sphaeroides]